LYNLIQECPNSSSNWPREKMRIVVATVALFLVLLNGGCAIIQKEETNRGGYLDYVLDEHWLKADSKSMRALRAFAMQVSLARIASVSAKNESDRQLLAIRIGALTQRFLPLYMCAFNNNPLAPPGSQSDPCFYYDSAMVDYSTGLFDLAMIALPIEDGQKLVSAVSGAITGPVDVINLLNTLLQIGKDAIKFGRIVGALYRDTVELEVQVWLATPPIDTRPSPFNVTIADVTSLYNVYIRGNDNMTAWLSEMAALRVRGLEPMPQAKFFYELGALMSYICSLVTSEPTTKANCQKSLPTPSVALLPVSAIGPTSVPFRIGDIPIRPPAGGGSQPKKQATTEMPPGGTAPAPGTNPAQGDVPAPKTAGTCRINDTLKDMLATVQNNQKIINGSEQSLANPSSPSLGAKTVLDAGKQVAAALNCISSQLQQASNQTTAADVKADYKKIQDKITGHVGAIGATLGKLSDSSADKQTVVQAAKGLNVLLLGAPGLTGVNSTVNDAVHVLGG
jgi:hypothetical protein